MRITDHRAHESKNRKDALKRLNGLAPQVEKHLAKIADDPHNQDVPHWVKEINSWIEQMESILPDIGAKTSAKWRERIAGWRAQLGEEHGPGQ
jgi:hypothetical protein